MELPRILLSAPASGSGKTMITCGILQALTDRNLRPVSFKCGPDYIDPMFHRTVIGTPSRNLDTFFTDESTTRYLMERAAAEEGARIAVVEGVMGYYDGLAGISDKASAFDVSRVTETPTVLIVNCRGMSLSIGALVKGFLTFREGSRIQGVILNRMSGMLYPRVKEELEKELHIRVLGYVPETDLLKLESRHLGLVMPDEVQDLKEKVRELAKELEKTLDIDALVELAKGAPAISGSAPEIPHVETAPVIAVARDEAFCFYYQDNLRLLEEAGAKICSFSPMHDEKIPEADGLLLGGGYPELNLPVLSANQSMLMDIREKIAGGMPTLAECGGFMYLMEEMEDLEGKSFPVAGVFKGKAFRTAKLQRFGYIDLTANEDQMLGQEGSILGHEFHYFDTTDNGEAYHASKPLSKRGWDCMKTKGDTLLAGFPHLYYYSNPEKAAHFVSFCAEYKKRRLQGSGIDRESEKGLSS